MAKIKEIIWVYITSKTISNFDKNNGNNKLRLFKFINFLLLINQDVLSDLQLQFWWYKIRYDAVVNKKSDSEVEVEVW